MKDLHASPMGARIRALRLERRLSLAETAQCAGLSEATMSRIENGHSEISAPALYGLARQFGVDISTFFADPTMTLQPGFRALTRAHEGESFASARMTSRLLAGELVNKRMHPFVNRVTAQTLAEAGGMTAHEGEEFLHVLSGHLLFHSAGYVPLMLAAGDALYFDARQPHAYLAAGPEGADFLVVSTIDAPDAMKREGETG